MRLKRALPAVLALLALTGCDAILGSDDDDVFQLLSVPRQSAPDIPVGDPLEVTLTTQRGPGVIAPAVLFNLDPFRITTGFNTLRCPKLSATADIREDDFTLRVTIEEGPTENCPAGEYNSVIYTASFPTPPPAGTYRIRIVHDDRLLDHRYVALEFDEFPIPESGGGQGL